MFSDFEAALFIVAGTSAAMIARHFATRFVRRRHYSGRRQTMFILTPMFGAMFLILNAFWIPITWFAFVSIPIVTLVQVAFMLPIIFAFSFLPNPFRKPASQDERESS
jgi:hypothetical protein